MTFSLSLVGCSFFPYTADLSGQSVRPPTLLVASPIPRTLFIVMTPENVSDAFPIRNSSNSVVSFRSYFGDALENTLRPYFQAIVVVSERPSASALAAAGPSAVADIRVDGVDARDLPVGGLVYTTLHIQWAFAVRLAEADEYLYSYAGTGISEQAYNTLEQGFEQMMLSALSAMMERWTEDRVFDTFRAAASAGTSAPASAGGETPPAGDPTAAQ